jgi:hypothetical protein
MAREIDFSNLDTDDLLYLQSRSWLIDEAERYGHTDVRSRIVALHDGTLVGEVVDEADESGEDDGEEVAYADAKVEELRAELKERGLDTTGKKEELVARLEADDAADDDEEEEEDA